MSSLVLSYLTLSSLSPILPNPFPLLSQPSPNLLLTLTLCATPYPLLMPSVPLLTLSQSSPNPPQPFPLPTLSPHPLFPSNEKLVSISKASFAWPGEASLFQDVEFNVSSKARFALLGKNGCGKSFDPCVYRCVCVTQCVCESVCLCVHLCVCQCVCLSVCVSVCLYVCIYPSVVVSMFLFTPFPSLLLPTIKTAPTSALIRTTITKKFPLPPSPSLPLLPFISFLPPPSPHP